MDITDFLQVGRDAGMDAKVPSVDDAAKGQHLEEDGDHFVYFSVVLIAAYILLHVTLVSKVVLGCQDLGFVVPSQQNHLFGVAQFEGEQESEDLDVIVASVDVIAQEHVFLLWGKSISLKNIEKVVELTRLGRLYPWTSPTTMAGEEV